MDTPLAPTWKSPNFFFICFMYFINCSYVLLCFSSLGKQQNESLLFFIQIWNWKTQDTTLQHIKKLTGLGPGYSILKGCYVRLKDWIGIPHERHFWSVTSVWSDVIQAACCGTHSSGHCFPTTTPIDIFTADTLLLRVVVLPQSLWCKVRFNIWLDTWAASQGFFQLLHNCWPSKWTPRTLSQSVRVCVCVSVCARTLRLLLLLLRHRQR